jgi:pimeloyl-ACP methyl ester carboxylesterase
MNPLVIIHGWSDESGSFDDLHDFVGGLQGVPPAVIHLADWISMDDRVTYQDIALAMDRAWKAKGLPTTPRSVDVIVHSTGALVTRHWMTLYHTPATVPIHRFVMLAPANFGSPLAHKGHSFIGRAIKGWKQPDFQTGKEILKGLELASPYTFHLASKDLFVAPGGRWYGRDRILATILVGDTGYSGISAIANEDGSDGTVRISTANLNCARLTAVLGPGQVPKTVELQRSVGSIAFGVVKNENHSTIAFKDKGPKNPATSALIQAALAVQDADYSDTGAAFAWQAAIDAQTGDGGRKHRFQNTVIRLSDSLGQDITDYFVELYRKTGADMVFEQQIYQKVVKSVHPYADNPALRSLYLDINGLDALGGKIAVDGLYLSISANPYFHPPESPVGYASIPPNQTGGLRIDPGMFNDYFAAHRTLLIDMQIERIVDDSVFRLP